MGEVDTLRDSVLNTEVSAQMTANAGLEAAISEKEEQAWRIKLAVAEEDVRHAMEMLAGTEKLRERQSEQLRLLHDQARMAYQLEQILAAEAKPPTDVP